MRKFSALHYELSVWAGEQGLELPLNLILQFVLLPVYRLLLIGSEVTMDVGSLVSSVAMVLVIPFVLGYITKLMSRNSEKCKSPFQPGRQPATSVPFPGGCDYVRIRG